ncbi:heme biosynthesis HemY N-terminal domain-containing protein [Marinobacterium jannaschii]|uniref:heme biosynthesis HemY N-terminal domain-containing protein n=1 Tax=Marinobacterium jannaschii TaxID=64970 RepID=UPI000482F16A|nr:heme biosynthesis HemY N-terminal domain-containing protein [Marinobacterium jannaschii]
MKKLFLFLLIMLVAGAWIGEKMVQDPGYVLLAYNESTLETSLWVLLVVTAIGFVLLHWLVNLFFRFRLPTSVLKDWSDDRHQVIAQRKTLKGLMALSEGNWPKAQKLLSQAAERSELPLVNYLAAAQAAHEQGQGQQSDYLLQQARETTPEAEVAVGIVQSQIQLSRGELEPCLANLLKLRQLAPKNSVILKLLKDVQIRLGDWEAVSRLLPELKKVNALPADEIAQLEHTSHLRRIESSVEALPVETEDSDRIKALTQAWSATPKAALEDGTLVNRYTDLLLELGGENQAEQTLRELIKQQWNDSLVNLYGRIASEDPAKQLDQARSWAKKNPDSADLMLTLGRLSLRNQHWGQAVKYFEESFQIEPRAENLAELTRLLRHMGEERRVEQLLQSNLTLVAGGLPELPMPEAAATS